MARNNDRDRGAKRTIKDARPRGRKKVCIFCEDNATWVDYKDVNLLRRFMSDRGKIRARRVTGNCSQHRARRSGCHQDGAGVGPAAPHAADWERAGTGTRSGPAHLPPRGRPVREWPDRGRR